MSGDEVQIYLSTLNERQRIAFDVVDNHANSGEQLEPLKMVVCGTTGTGKTYLINAFKQVLDERCMLTATTGIIAFGLVGQHCTRMHSCQSVRIKISKVPNDCR